MPFTERQRQIYSYFDGTREIRADPMVLLRRWRAALAKLPDPDPVLERLGFVDPSALEDRPKPEELPDDLVLDALAKATPAIREAFGVRAFGQDEGSETCHGLTEWEQVALLADFLVWLDDAKKASGSTPSSSTPSPGGDGTTGLPTGTTPTPEPAPTASTSASG